jgi:hypothetical protein
MLFFAVSSKEEKSCQAVKNMNKGNVNNKRQVFKNIRFMVLGFFIIALSVSGFLTLRSAKNNTNNENMIDEKSLPKPWIGDNISQIVKIQTAREEELLNSYSWVNKENRIVRIPIEVAMKKLIKKGLSYRDE